MIRQDNYQHNQQLIVNHELVEGLNQPFLCLTTFNFTG